ncbi:GDP-mannose 4,6-dehydratase [archaeon]|nr:GDP-mannose 4,6-dehydratase [archaeon]
MSVLVTGGCGFIGSHLVNLLLSDSAEVNVLDDLSNSAKDSCPSGAKLRVGSVTDKEAVRKALKDCDIVFHLAAKISVPESIKDPLMTMHTNAEGTGILLEECRRSETLESFVLASSAAVYGDAGTKAVKETDYMMPLSPYGQSKIEAEKLCARYADETGLKASSLRIFNVYGAGQSREYAGVISRFVENAKTGKPLTVFGDGNQTRDFVYVQDACEAFLLASKVRGTFNIGSGKSTTINELAALVLELTGSSSPIRRAQSREGDILHSLADVTLAKKRLGWKPKTELREGLKELV